MADSTMVKWDTDSLGGAVKSLKAEGDKLREHRNFLRGLKDTVASSWESPAGRQYLERMSAETETLDDILRMTEEQINAINKVISQCYTACENEVAKGLGRLEQSGY